MSTSSSAAMFFKTVINLLLILPVLCHGMHWDPAWGMAYPTSSYLDSKFMIYQKLLSAAIGGHSSPNVILSPSNIHQTLLVMHLASDYDTRESLRQFLRLHLGQGYNTKIMLSYEGLSSCDAGRTYSPAVFDFRNGAHIYVSDDLKIKNHELPASNVNFSQHEEVVKKINKWVEDQTGGMIRHFMDAGLFVNSSDLFLVTAATLKALWAKQFDPQFTDKGDFHLENGTVVNTTMMSQEGLYKTLIYKDIDILQLPYARSDVSMYILMPPLSSKAVLNMVSDLNTFTVNEIKQRMHGTEARFRTIQIPKFSLESEINLMEMLDGIGAGDIFNGSLSLGIFLETSKRVHLDRGIHKAKIQVDEQGTEAAAASNLTTKGELSFKDVFSVNRPFLFVIYQTCSDTMLFAGAFNSPQ